MDAGKSMVARKLRQVDVSHIAASEQIADLKLFFKLKNIKLNNIKYKNIYILLNIFILFLKSII